LIAVSGDIYLGNVKVDDTNQEQVRRTFAFVGQEDVLHQQSTPREAIRFSAKLRLGREFSDDDINTLVEGYVEELGLTKCADSLIGGELMKGISGGTLTRGRDIWIVKKSNASYKSTQPHPFSFRPQLLQEKGAAPVSGLNS